MKARGDDGTLGRLGEGERARWGEGEKGRGSEGERGWTHVSTRMIACPVKWDPIYWEISLGID